MKIVIADDEKFIRLAIKSMLQELNRPLEIREAANGKELLDLAGEWQPDIALVDIKMPVLSGLEAIEQAKKTNKHTKWFILTTYSKFDYAKEAINLEVMDYLLKPVKPEDLALSLAKVDQIINERAHQKNQEIENRIRAIFSNLLFIEEYDFLRQKKLRFKCLVILYDSFPGKTEQLKSQTTIYNHLTMISNDYIKGGAYIVLIPLNTGELAIITIWEENKQNAAGARINKFHTKTIFTLKKYIKHNFLISLLETGICPNFQDLHFQITSLMSNSHLRIFLNDKVTIQMHDMEELTEKQHGVWDQLATKLVELSVNFRDKSYLGFMKIMDALERLSESILIAPEPALIFSLNRYTAAVFNFTSPLWTETGLQLSRLQNVGNEILKINKKAAKQYSKLIEKVICYIEKNYMHDIGIARIASELKITPNYLSYLFHKSAGTTYLKYLTRLRMRKAKELLLSPGAKINEVAVKVGYQNPTHFTKIFKKNWNISPRDFQKSL